MSSTTLVLHVQMQLAGTWELHAMLLPMTSPVLLSTDAESSVVLFLVAQNVDPRWLVVIG